MKSKLVWGLCCALFALQSSPVHAQTPENSSPETTSKLELNLLLEQGEQALQAKDYEAALAHFESALEQAPRNYRALFGKARAEAFSERHAQAIESYSVLLEAFPDNRDALVGRGRVYAWQKQYSEAEADFRAALSLAPENESAWSALANVYRWSGQRKQFRTHLEAWKTAFPESHEPYLEEIQQALALRHLNQARQALQAARERGADPTELDRLSARLNRQPGALPWEVMLLYEPQFFNGPQSPWHTFNGSVGYNFDGGTVRLEGIATQRFDVWDQALAADSYLELWPGAYGNFRLQGAINPQVLPVFDGLAEIYQSIGDIWEASLAYRLMNYPTNNVHFLSASGGVYLGDWYLRVQPQVFLSGNGPGSNLILWARYFLNTADDYIELRTGFGQRVAVVDTAASGTQLQDQGNAFGLLTAQYFFTPQWGLIGTLNYNYDQQFSDRFGGSIGSRYRW